MTVLRVWVTAYHRLNHGRGAAWVVAEQKGPRWGYAALANGEDFYSVDEAARILKATLGRIRQMLRSGEFEDISP